MPGARKKIGHTGVPFFWTVEFQQHALDPNAIQRKEGLVQMLNGLRPLADAMGTDEDMTIPLVKIELTLCQDCAMENDLVLFNWPGDEE